MGDFDAQLGKPGIAGYQRGRFTLHRTWNVGAAAATPVVATNLENVRNLTTARPSYDGEDIVIHQGGVGPSYDKYGAEWTGEIQCLKGHTDDVLAQLRNVTLSVSAGHAALPFNTARYEPQYHMESILRQKNNRSQIGSVLHMNMIPEDMGFDNPLEYADGAIPYKTRMPPAFLYIGSKFVMDAFTGDGSTVVFTTSATPIQVVESDDHDMFIIDDLLFVQVMASGETEPTLQLTGISYATNAVTFDTAPAASALVYVGYAAVGT